MRRLGIVLILIIVGLCTPNALPVSSNPAAQQQPEGRASYDPMAHGKRTGQPKSIVETTLAGVNPKDKDYGAVVADWRKEIFEDTLHEIYFWGLIGITMLFGISVMANGWLLRERERRLTITADIVTQLYNAHVMSRAKALKAISRHNQLVERYNQLDQEAADLRVKIVTLPQPESAPSSDFTDARNAKPAESGAAPVQQTAPVASESVDLDGTPDAELRSKVEELALELKRKKAQIQAKDDQITNLRKRLTLAHDSLQGERAQKAADK